MFFFVFKQTRQVAEKKKSKFKYQQINDISMNIYILCIGIGILLKSLLTHKDF